MHIAKAIHLRNQLSSPEGIALLEKINGNMHMILSALDSDNIIKSIRSLSEEDFYTKALIQKSVRNTILNEQAAASSMVDFGKGLALTTKKKATAKKTDDGTATTTDAEIDAAASGVEGVDSEKGMSIMSILSAMTEGGTWQGITHLVLDFLGVIGDYFMASTGIPVGIVADIINAGFYFYRGKGLLGVISLVAAAIPFGGDILKAFKPFIKSLAPAWAKIATKGAGKRVTEESAKILAKADPRTFTKMNKFMQFLKKSVGTITSKILRVMQYLTKNVLGEIVGWVPVLGKPLKKAFTKLGDLLGNVSDNLITFSKSIDGAVQKQMAGKAEKTFKMLDASRGAKITREGNHLIIKKFGKSGGIKKIPIDEFVKYAQVVKKYPSGPLAKFLKNSDNVADFYAYLAKNGFYSEKFLARYAGSSILRGAKLSASAFGIFIMKQMVKLFGSQGDAMSDFEKKQMANIVTTSQLHKIVKEDNKRERDKLNSVVAAPLRDLFSGHEGEKGDVAIALQKHLNYNAKRMGMPNIQTYFGAQAKWNREKEIEKLYSGFSSDKEYEEALEKINAKDKKMKSDSIDRSPQPDSFDDTPNESISYEKMKYIKLFHTA